MIPVIHTVCGKQVGWHNGEATDRRSSKRYIRMDGSSPEPNSIVREHCQHCNAVIQNPLKTMKLDFEQRRSDPLGQFDYIGDSVKVHSRPHDFKEYTEA